MLLGDLIAHFDDEAVAAEALLSLDDLALTARVHEAAAAHEITAGEFARFAVQQFSADANDEDWVTVIGQMGRTEKPGQVLLRRALLWALTLQPAGAA